jgi:hypothetical protein
MNSKSLAIVGSSCRHKSEMDKMTPSLFNKMVAKARRVFEDGFSVPGRTFTLVSGGSSCADHVAVVLWLEHRELFGGGLRIYLPCRWSSDAGSFDPEDSCGRTLNRLHRSFSLQTGRKTLSELSRAKIAGAEFISTASGFLGRNDQVVQSSDLMLAMTWSDRVSVWDSSPGDSGGTAYTWNKFRKPKIHIPITSLDTVLHRPLLRLHLARQVKRRREEEEEDPSKKRQRCRSP